MADTYTKLFSSITESTVWGEPYPTRIVWVAMLAMADANGQIYAAIPGLARRANVTVQETQAALDAFMAADPWSRTPDNDGRRIEAIDGGWRLLNHAKYRALRSSEDRNAAKREWDRNNRPSGQARAKQSGGSPNQSDKNDQSGPTSTSTSTSTSTKEEAKATVHSAAPTAQDAIAVPDGLPDDIAAPVAPGSADKAKRIRGEKKPQTAARFPEFYAAYPVKKDRAKAEAAWRKRGCDDIADTLIAHVRRMESEDSHWGRGFIIHPTTYINGERWTDEPTKDVQAVGKAEPSGKLPAAKDVLSQGESALEAALGHLRQRHGLGAFGEGEEGEAEYRRQVQAAMDKHRGQHGN